MAVELPAAVKAWEAAGAYRDLAGHRVFTMDRPAADGGLAGHEPVLVLHGFPTSSFDWRHVLPALSAERRVVLLDFLGHGLSAKPDQAYALAEQADVVQALVAELGLTRFALVTHDMGDTIGGELLARHIDGQWRVGVGGEEVPVEITKRVISNGSIYIEMAHLTAGQQLLLSLPDEALPEMPFNPASSGGGIAAVFSPDHQPDEEELSCLAALVGHLDGHRTLPRVIRYIEERRANERRYTGAIESHTSPLAIVWATDDPVAVAPMAEVLHQARPDATLTWLHGLGHYPMVEGPTAFVTAVLAGL